MSMSSSPINATTGSQGCHCINMTNQLLSLTDLACALPNGQNGFRFTIGGPCLDFSYGSNYCLQHDLLWNKKTCSIDEAGVNVVPAHCFRPWCYVDAASCGRDSEERAFQSSYIPFESGINIHYSYSTCNSTAVDWLEYAAGHSSKEDKKLGGINIRATVPYYQIPSLYKTVNGEKTIVQGDEYFNDSIPFEGIYPTYIQNIADTTNGDIQNITFTHLTRASRIVHPYSKATSACQDVADGLSDMVIGPIWITGQRLALTAFTIPFVVDKSYLVVPREGSESLTYQIQKVLQPFSPLLWLCILLVICFASSLSVWFWIRANPTTHNAARGERGRVSDRRKAELCRLCLDSFLEKFTFFTSAGVEQDSRASLPTKILMFGFGAFILISVSAYVANLAAFLTKSGDESVTSMEAAVALKLSICAHPAIEQELRDAWPDGNFYFHQEGNEFRGILQDYDEGKCSVMVVGWEDTVADTELLNMYCERNIAFTDGVIAEIPMAWPTRPQLASGLSYWIYNAQKYDDITSTSVTQEYLETNGFSSSCDLKLSTADREADDTTPIEVRNMFLPLILFVICALLAAMLQIIHERRSRTSKGKEKPSVLGRVSTLHLFTENKDARQKIKYDEDEYFPNPKILQQQHDEEEFFDAQDITGVKQSNGIGNVVSDKDGASTESAQEDEPKRASFRTEDSFLENRRLSLERS